MKCCMTALVLAPILCCMLNQGCSDGNPYTGTYRSSDGSTITLESKGRDSAESTWKGTYTYNIPAGGKYCGVWAYDESEHKMRIHPLVLGSV
jgi:hypothetical protein